MIDFTHLQDITYNFKPHNYFNPILWFGAPFEIVFNSGKELYLYVFSVLLIVVPMVCFVVYIKLSKKMESLLLKLEGEGKDRPIKHRLDILIGKILNRNEYSRQSFYFSNAVIRSDRRLKLKIYPTLSTGILFPVIMIFNIGMRGQDYVVGNYEYLYLYFNFMIIPTILDLLQYSLAYKGSYVYYASGFKNIYELYKGTLQCVAVRLMIPLMIINIIVYIMLFKERFIVDLIIIMLVSLAVLPILSRIMFNNLPFSKPIDESNKSKSIDKFIASIGVIACFIVPHIIFNTIAIGSWIYITLLVIGIPISWKFAIPNKIKFLSE